MDFQDGGFVGKEDCWQSAELDAKPATSTASVGEVDWFLKADWKPSASVDPPLTNCSLCNRIVLLDRFQQHSCQLRPTLKREKAEGDCRLSVRHSGRGRSSRERAGDAVPRRGRERARQSKTSTGSQEGESNGRKRQGKRKRGGPACAPKEFCYGNSGGSQWLSGRQHLAPGQKTRKLKDIIKNGPTVFPPVSLSRILMGAGVDLRQHSNAMVEPLEGQLQNCMVVWGWKGPGSGSGSGSGSPTKRAKVAGGKRGSGKGDLRWWEEWGHLFDNGVFGFPASVRRQRSPIPVRRSRYPSLEPNGDELDPEMLLGSPLWYTSAFEPLGDTFGSLTVFGFG